jgi:hypothetical protein
MVHWEYFIMKSNSWVDITPSEMDAIIAHGLEPQPLFRKKLKTNKKI